MKKILILGVLITITGISIALASPLFYNTEIDEQIPSNSMMEEEFPIYEGSFVGVNDGIHNAEGLSRTIQVDQDSNILRLENFKSTNGPDLYVYLSTDKEATDFVDLGRLKANTGNQNYEIPQGTDLEKYNQVLIWCKSFSVLFGSAELNIVQ